MNAGVPLLKLINFENVFPEFLHLMLASLFTRYLHHHFVVFFILLIFDILFYQEKVSTVPSLDLDVIVQASQTISNEVRYLYDLYFICLFYLFFIKVDFDTLVIKMVKAIVQHANAQRGTFFIGEETPTGKTQLWVCAEYVSQSR